MIRANEIKMVNVGDVQPWEKNPNKHSKEQIERLCQIIKYQGFRNPLVVSNQSGKLIVGHGRLEAAKKLGLKQVPVIYQDFESEEQAYAHCVADNAIADWAELDLSSITNEALSFGDGFNMDLFGLKDFDPFPEELPPGDPDEVPDVPTEPISKLGDLYELGRHRLLCGDATIIDHVQRLMGDNICEITFTSPPYNLGDNAKLRGWNGDGKDSAYNDKTDHKSQDSYLDFLKSWTTLALQFSKVTFSNIQLLAGNKLVLSEYWSFFRKNLVDIMIWDKEHAQPSAARRVLNSVWEFIFIFANEDCPTRSIKVGKDFRGTLDNVYRLNPVGKKDELAKSHGAVFPVQFAEYFIEKFTNDSVLDLFGGSGTTLIAAEKQNVKCFMMELDPRYVDVIVSRYCKYVGNYKIKRNSEIVDWKEETQKQQAT